MGENDERDGLTDRIRSSTELLEEIAGDRALLLDVDEELRQRLLIAAGRVSRPNKRARKAMSRARRRGERTEKRNADRDILAATGIRKLRESPIFQTPRRRQLYGRLEAAVDLGNESSEPIGEVREERCCYVCRREYREIHFFYDQMCIECGDFNFEKRTQEGDLSGRVALVTGARVKIGYQAAILLLRSGCHVIVATRFPRDAAKRYAAEEDFAEWGGRLEIHGIDLRYTPSVERLCKHLLERHTRLDFIINNACQTVRRPPGFYDHLMALEEAPPSSLSANEQALLAPVVAQHVAARHVTDQNVEAERASTERVANAGSTVSSASLSQMELLDEDRDRGNHLFPAGELDADLQQVDLRKVNSWRLKLADVPAIELLEVHLVNAVAPFILNARLKPLMAAVPTADKHIVNVSAMEGQFYRTFKTDRHPHTNMAKASLNMMTRTSAADYIDAGIHMNSVDTGWVTDEDPVVQAAMKREVHNFHPPLDIVDGAARIVDPIFTGINTGKHVWGQFLKDYKETDW